MKNIVFFLFATLGTLNSTAADVIVLLNQMAFEGKVVRIKNCSVVFKADGDKYVIPASDIFSIEFEDVENKVYTRYLELEVSDSEKCLRARTDAQQLHGKKAGHIVLGFLFGPFAVLGTALSNPLPHRGKNTYQYSQNRHMFKDPVYLKCYMRTARVELIAMELLGWGAWAVVWFTILN